LRLLERFTEAALLCWLLSLTAVLYSLTPIHNGNIFWHLRNGIDIIETGEIRTADPFTWTREGAYWIQHEWLAESAMALSWITLGEAGPVLLKALFIGLSVFFAFKASIKNGAKPRLAFALGAFWLALAQPRWIARPHIFSIFFFSLYLYILSFKTHKPWKLALQLLPLQILWVNTHAGFVMGMFLASLPAIEEISNGKYRDFFRWLLPPAVLLLASGIHPNGFRTLEYLPAFLAQPLFKQSIREWWSPFDPRYAPERIISKTALILTGLTLGTTGLLIRFSKKIVPGKIIALFILTTATVFASRNGELLAPAILAWVPGMLKIKLHRSVGIVIAVVLLTIPFAYGVPREIGPPKKLGIEVDWDVYPVEIANLLENNPELMEQAVLFNSNEISGYLEFRFGEQLPLFMDGRCLLFSEALFRDYLLLIIAPDQRYICVQKWLFDRYDFNLMIYSSRDRCSSVYLAAKLPEWVPIQTDGLTSTYAKWGLLQNTGLESLAFRYFDPLDPDFFLTIPLYKLPAAALPELLFQKGQSEHSILDYAIQALEFRLDPEYSLQLSGEGEGIHYQTLLCWNACRNGDLQSAAVSAQLSRDLTLQSAVSWLQNGKFRGGEEIAGIPTGIISYKWDNKVVDIMSLWVTGQQCKALDEAELCLDSLPPWGVAQCAWLYSLSGEQTRAEELTDMALRMADNPIVLEKSALVFRTGGNHLKAVELCSRALAVSPLFAEARLVMANSLWDMNRIRDAGVEYRWLVEHDIVLPMYATERLLLLEKLENRYTPAGGEGT